ncbi:MAG TPA: DUF1501 domain-containing protein [Tepidisphaeraceae bacterium]|nr:DUF1501 domain-containing protein [Tepidisphaeraceae bacterium]
MHCGQFISAPLSRRQMLSRCAGGFGAVALASLLGQRAYGGAAQPFAARAPHYPARAKSVIFLYMDGGPSQMDTFDPKPLLTREHGQPFKMKMEPTQFNNNGNTLGSPWKFKSGGKSGLPVSDLFPFVRECADDLCVIRSMTSDFSEHTGANYFLHTGNGQQGRPSMGSWVTYGLGSASQNLPGFIVLDGGLIPPGGLDNFNSGFLPATFQGSVFKPAAQPVANIAPTEANPRLQRNKLSLMAKLDGEMLRGQGPADAVESAISNYELAFEMQSAVPELMNLSGESAATRKLYGLDAPFVHTRTFGAECLLARRLVERGVRFVELTCPAAGGDRWDQHSGLKQGHTANSLAVDQPIAGLLKDLKSRGMLDETLVVWAGEFGRTPFAQGSDGRDHNPFGYSVWLAGGGAKGGYIHGATDDYGYKVVENKLEMYDLHATMLRLLGMNHKRLTYRWGGRDMRLTDVHGEIVEAVIA